MSETRALTRKQSAVVEELFTGDLEEPAVLEKHHVRPRQYERWLADENFTDHIERRIAHARRQSRIVLARHATQAASTLVGLTRCEKQETARKACLDIIVLQTSDGQRSPGDDNPDPAGGGLTPATASRLLAALAGDRRDRAEDLPPSAGV